MSQLLVRNVHTLVTMNAAREELKNASLLLRDGVIERVGHAAELPLTADEVLDYRRHVDAGMERLLSEAMADERRRQFPPQTFYSQHR